METALETLQAKRSDEPHPLLAPQLLVTGKIRHDSDDPNNGLTLPAFGSLTLGDDVSDVHYSSLPTKLMAHSPSPRAPPSSTVIPEVQNGS